MKNGDKAATPFQPCGPDGLPSYEAELGLTKREMMSMHMMAGMLRDEVIQNAAKLAVAAADALLAALERTDQ